ncbi:phage baseplate assembly protein V [Serratia sp. NPDC078593]|uniref:phage baseplate assembly protein V n=1 Tax=unclassified Serratia (in: enterobacteria) TaxID=2647522 RepID=UPI0037D18321
MNNLTLKIAGQACSLGIRWLRVQQQINEIPTARIELRVPTDNNGATDGAVKQEVSRFTLGATVAISLDGKPLFNGHLAQKKMQLKGKYWSVRLEARHVLQKLTFLPRSRVFLDQNDGTILKGLFQQAGVKVTQKAAKELSSKHEQMVQFRLCDWRFIRNRLLSTNCWLLPDAASNSVVISPLAEPATVSQTLECDGENYGYSLYDVNLNFDNRFTLDSLSLQGWDIADQKLTSEQKSQAKSFRPWKPEPEVKQAASWQQDYALAFSDMPETTLQSLSKSWLSHQQMTGLQGSILLSGTRDFKLGESIKLSRFGAGLDGTAILTGVNQQFDIEQGWRSELVVGMATPILETIPPVQSLHIATVAKFKADPKHQDRIAIHLPALGLPDATLLARLSKPWASKASGFCFYPEPGDEVVVGFIESDPRYPIILGAMHNPKNTAPFPPHEKNNRKGLVVDKDGKQEALLIDTDKKTLVLSADKNTVTLTGEGDITFDTPKTLKCNVDTLIQQAENNVSITGKKQVEITSANINMKK